MHVDSSILPILAAGDDQYVKLIVGIIAAVVWGIGAVINQAKKKQKEQGERQQHHDSWVQIEQEMRERAARAQTALQPPALPSANRPVPPPPPVFAPTRSIEGPYVPQLPASRPAQRSVQRQVQRQPQRPVQRRPVAQRPKPIAPPPAPRAVVQAAQQRPKKHRAPPAPSPAPAVPAAARAEAARPIASSHAAAPTSASAAAVARWLNAKTLRSQFILTEILQPPLALRGGADGQPRGL